MKQALRDLFDEYQRATSLHKRFNSAHEGYAVILEEVRELEKEVFKKQEARRIGKMRIEALHIATMSIRFMVDICNLPLSDSPPEKRRE